MTTRCRSCKRFEPLRPNFTGVTRDKHDKIISATYRCECGEVREIPTGRTTIEQMAAARLAELNNMRAKAAV